MDFHFLFSLLLTGDYESATRMGSLVYSRCAAETRCLVKIRSGNDLNDKNEMPRAFNFNTDSVYLRI